MTLTESGRPEQTERLLAKLRQGPTFDQGYGRVGRAVALQGDIDEMTGKRLLGYTSGTPVWSAKSFDQYEPHGKESAGFGQLPEMADHLQRLRLSSGSESRRHLTPQWLADPATLPLHSPRIAFRIKADAGASRTVVACLAPAGTGLTASVRHLSFPFGGGLVQAFVLGVLNSLSFDWQARRLAETTAGFPELDAIRFPPVETSPWAQIGQLAARLSCVDERFLGFALETGVVCGPLDTGYASGMRARIDALVAHSYGMGEADLQALFDDFSENAVPTRYRGRVVEQFLLALGNTGTAIVPPGPPRRGPDL